MTASTCGTGGNKGFCRSRRDRSTRKAGGFGRLRRGRRVVRGRTAWKEGWNGKAVDYPYLMALEVHCINSGQGNSVALRLPDDTFMVVDIDCHGDTPVDPVDYLKELLPEEYDDVEERYVRRLACAAFTHPHQDHISGLKPLVDAGFVFDEICGMAPADALREDGRGPLRRKPTGLLLGGG